MRKIKNILILAGGDSTRFWPLGDKNSLSFFGKPLIVHRLNELQRYAEHIFIVVNKNNVELFKQQLIHTTLIPQHNSEKGQADAILSAQHHINGEVLIVNANDIFNPHIVEQLITNISKEKPKLLFLAKKTSSYFPGGYLKFKEASIERIIEKPDPAKTPSDMVKLVVDYFPNYGMLVNALMQVKTYEDSRYEEAINYLIFNGAQAGCIEYTDYWYTLKFPWELLSLTNHFLHCLRKNSIARDASISKKAIIIPPVTIESRVVVGDFSKIVGPCYIGEGTVIGDFVMIRESHIGNNCLIGGYSEITRSYLSNNLMTHRNYIGDSAIDENVLIGAGAVTANFRFDQGHVGSKINGKMVNSNRNKLGAIIGKQTKIGVNTTILPGKKIGKRCFIAPGSIIKDDIEDNT